MKHTHTAQTPAVARRLGLSAIGLALLLASSGGLAQAPGPAGNRPAPPHQPPTVTPPHSVDVILGRPTATSIVLSILCSSEARALVAYGTHKTELSARTEGTPLKTGVPLEVILAKLTPDTRYYYQLREAMTDKPMCEGSFHTARPPGGAFTFTVTADSHLDLNTDPALYQCTLANALTDAPDFHLDLGDTFMTEKHENRDNATGSYLAQRFYLGQLCRSAPLYLALGNHDGEESKLLRGGTDSLAVWANTMRKRYFPNPVPDSFYTGNATRDPLAGQLQDYYAWQWADALFVVLDPFWFSATKQRGPGDNWKRTLGTEQVEWLQRTLETRQAKFKFVFLHNLVGGATPEGRGGAEAAAFYEWGGRNPDGTDGFKEKRPGWLMPIHSLLVKHHVSIVFHGHDHLYAKQELDGIVYQAVPQPGDPRGNTRNAAEYSYKSGIILPSAGHLRVTVSPIQATVDYVRTDRSVAQSYAIPASTGQ